MNKLFCSAPFDVEFNCNDNKLEKRIISFNVKVIKCVK